LEDFIGRTMMRYLCAILCFAVSVCFGVSDALPDVVFRDLADVPHHPLEPGEKVASVLVFFWQDCPVSNGYVPELNRIAAGRTNCAFYIVQVDPELTPAAAREHAAQYHLSIPVLLDPKHQLVKVAHATTTPEAVVFGKKGDVLYRGRIDDNYAAFGKKRASVRQHDLIDALDAITAGQPVKPRETKAIGCLIQ
jgi:hypothetical protein